MRIGLRLDPNFIINRVKYGSFIRELIELKVYFLEFTSLVLVSLLVY